jgi:hypothetical protein
VIEFFRNGESVGVAFTGVPNSQVRGLRPGLSPRFETGAETGLRPGLRSGFEIGTEIGV